MLPRAAVASSVASRVQVLSLHCNLDEKTKHLVNSERLGRMKPTAVLINASRGPVVDEAALVKHLQSHPEFFAGLDVFEDEPAMKPGLEKCSNAVIVPHIASASLWTRSGMATLAAANVAARLQVWRHCARDCCAVLAHDDLQSTWFLRSMGLCTCMLARSGSTGPFDKRTIFPHVPLLASAARKQRAARAGLPSVRWQRHAALC